jgi:hypothetical protein
MARACERQAAELQMRAAGCYVQGRGRALRKSGKLARLENPEFRE